MPSLMPKSRAPAARRQGDYPRGNTSSAIGDPGRGSAAGGRRPGVRGAVSHGPAAEFQGRGAGSAAGGRRPGGRGAGAHGPAAEVQGRGGGGGGGVGGRGSAAGGARGSATARRPPSYYREGRHEDG